MPSGALCCQLPRTSEVRISRPCYHATRGLAPRLAECEIGISKNFSPGPPSLSACRAVALSQRVAPNTDVLRVVDDNLLLPWAPCPSGVSPAHWSAQRPTPPAALVRISLSKVLSTRSNADYLQYGRSAMPLGHLHACDRDTSFAALPTCPLRLKI